MFNNIDEKIKGLAIASTVIGCIVSLIAAIYCYVVGLTWLGSGILIAGGFVSWIGSFLLYGFGELITQTTKIANGNVASQKVEDCKNPKKSVDEPQNDVNKTQESKMEYYAYDDIAAEDERNIAQQDECPCCFSKISPNDKECSFCGLKLK